MADNKSSNNPPLSYLYLAEDPLTCIYEVRPTIGQHVSVAQFEVKRELQIYNLDHHFPQKPTLEEELTSETALFEYIGKQFSKPYTSQPLQYLPTQFLGETIKQMGFDGLRFCSSLHKGGHNIVLFDNADCIPISSDYIKVDEIKFVFSKPELYQIDEINNSLYTENPSGKNCENEK